MDTSNTIAPQTEVASPETVSDLFITVPETKLPNGTVVPAFQVGQYATSQSDDGKAIIVANRKPWVNINYHKAKEAAEAAGYKLITELQWLAMAFNATNVAANWTKGEVGKGKLFRGIRNGHVSAAQAGDFIPTDKKERRWLTLSNGEIVCDINGNVFQWVFDDVHGDENGLINKRIEADDVSLMTPPYFSEQKGMGYRPDGARDWSGNALVRGGCWGSYDRAGAFFLNYGWPGGDLVIVGFRCTKSL